MTDPARGGPGSPTQQLASWVEALSISDMSGEVVDCAVRGLIDTLAVTLAGAHERAPLIVASALAGEHAREVGCQVTGRDLRTTGPAAALINGTAAHALEFDDTQANVDGHASAVVVPCGASRL